MKWHYGVGNQMLGPVEDEDLLNLVRSGTITPDTLVWASFLPKWTPAKEVKGLFKKAGVKLPPENVTSGKPRGDQSETGQKRGDATRPVEEALDHRVLNEIDGLVNPTAELLSKWVWDQLAPSLPLLACVRVHETCTSSAEYRGE